MALASASLGTGADSNTRGRSSTTRGTAGRSATTSSGPNGTTSSKPPGSNEKSDAWLRVPTCGSDGPRHGRS